ncbi:MAG: ATP synthase subunit alpha [Parcubacteria group bacterium GW2011_GWA2_42_18]|nr:MAG: ATP synthase subunit alpha [Parcubacteria group bacterium GW2011_GWA2_42_18]
MSKNYIVESLKKQIEEFHSEISTEKIGRVIEIFDGVAKISGLSDVQASEMIQFANGETGVALNLEEDTVGAVILGDFSKIREGDEVRTTGKVLSVPVSEKQIGRVLNALGEPVDGKGEIPKQKYNPIEKIAPGVITRQSVDTPVQTGIKVIDALIPIGRGQRELIIGDRQTGKTAIAIDTILNQKNQKIICIYVSIGQKESKLRKIHARLEEGGAMDYSIIVKASASDPASMNYIAPYTGVAIGEYFMEKGQDVLVIYDDLSKHAASYREISLLLRRPPGREAFPGDIFYLHSRLLERAAKLNKEHGGGSITALPIIETQAGDVSAYIPTNVISITDGQIYLETEAQFRELEAFTQFGSDLDAATLKQLERGKRAVELLKQNQYAPMAVEKQIVSLFALTKGYMDDVLLEKIHDFESRLLNYLDTNAKDFYDEVRKTGTFSEKAEERLKQAIISFKEIYGHD